MGVEVKTLEVETYTCDSCGASTTIPLNAGESVEGITLDWFEITSWGATGGKLWACRLTCAIKALRNRHDNVS